MDHELHHPARKRPSPEPCTAAAAAGNPQIDTLHLLAELLGQEDGVAVGLLAAVNPDAGALQTIGAATRRALTQLPASSGSSVQPAAALPRPARGSRGRFQRGQETR